MRTVYPNLQRSLNERGISTKELAAHLGIKTLHCKFKMYGVSPWTFTEVLKICKLLEPADAELLFVRLDIIS